MYTLKILPSEEFDNLPFKKAKTALGAADAKTGVAYIRDTGYGDITKHVIDHELDELIAKVSPHEEDGIRYKDLGGFLQGAGNLGKNVATGVGNVAKGAGNAVKSAGGGIMDFFKGGGGTQTPGMMQTTTGAMGGGAAQAGAGGFGKSIMDTFKQVAPGAGVALAGNLFAPKVKAPDFSGITNGLRAQASGQTPSEFRSLGGEELRRILQTPMNTPPESAFKLGDIYNQDQTTQDISTLEKEFKAVNPNADVENNSAFLRERGRINDRSREVRTAQRDQTSFDYNTQQMNNKFNAMSTALNLDQAQMSQMVQLAQMDISQIMLQTGLDQAEAQQIKDLFGNFGQLVNQNRMPTYNPFQQFAGGGQGV